MDLKFWKRKEKHTYTRLGHSFVPPPTPPKPQYETMLDLLREAESLENKGEKDTSNEVLKTLCNYINKYTSLTV